MKNDKWSRRKFSKAVLSAQLLLASGSLTLPLGCAKSNKPDGDITLDDALQETLKFAMDEIIPANEKMPSAARPSSFFSGYLVTPALRGALR